MRYIVFFLFLITIKAEAQECVPCTNCFGKATAISLLPLEATNRLLQSLKKEDTHPYEEACMAMDEKNKQILSAKSNDEKNNLNVFLSCLPCNTQDNKSVKTFLIDLKKNIQSRIALEKSKILNLKKCLQSGSKTVDECYIVGDKTKSVFLFGLDDVEGVYEGYKFSELVADTRSNLALAHPQSFFERVLSDESYDDLNLGMKSYGIHKQKIWAPLTEEERKKAKGKLKSYEEQAEANAKTDIIPKRYTREAYIAESVKESRYINQAVYTGLMAFNPILQFVKTANPSKQEMIEATNQMLSSIAKEEKWLAETTQSLNSVSKLDKDLLKLLNYSEEVTQTLNKSPEYCGIARDFKILMEAKQTGYDVAVIGPVAVASFFIKPVKATVLALGSSGMMFADEHRIVQETSFRVMGRMSGDSKKDLDELTEAYFNRNLEVIVAPTAILGVQVSSRYLKVLPQLSTTRTVPNLSRKTRAPKK